MFRRFKRKAKAEVALYCFVSLVFALIAATYVYIPVWTFISSIKTHAEIVLDPFGLPAVPQWKNYIEMFKVFEVNGHGFFQMLFNSVYFSVLGSLFTQYTTCTFSYCVTKYTFPGVKLIYPVIIACMTIPLYGNSGAMYKLYYNLGLVDTYAHLILAFFCGMGGTALFYRAYIQGISNAYMEAASIDGANDFQIYFRVMLPQIKPLFFCYFLTGWLGSWNDYSGPLVYLPNIPTLPVGIYLFNTEMIYRARLDVLFAACLFISIPALILFVAFNKVLTTSISIGGLKG